ncbi:hypothetical protein RHSIM_RhsimUnG0166100 [Rhododendron simsii]|uniref:Uncharacterized protein n=1 Tax=Rhododendron simsii TaxID=118357 RepID=A0A834FUR9_RHOSS|nr:hypothetical protein RHSIM_RhsimUnG0166100 [Rhododendron simsii]
MIRLDAISTLSTDHKSDVVTSQLSQCARALCGVPKSLKGTLFNVDLKQVLISYDIRDPRDFDAEGAFNYGKDGKELEERFIKFVYRVLLLFGRVKFE